MFQVVFHGFPSPCCVRLRVVFTFNIHCNKLAAKKLTSCSPEVKQTTTKSKFYPLDSQGYPVIKRLSLNYTIVA